MRALMTALGQLYDDDKAITAAAAIERREAARMRRYDATLPAQIRERLERAVLHAEQAASVPVEWPATLPSLSPHGTRLVESNILRLQSAADNAKPLRRAGRHPAGVFEAVDANDAWLLSVVVFNWRTSKLFRPIREAHDVPSYRLVQAARYLRGLLGERRGGSARAADSVRQLIQGRGDTLSALLRDFDEAFDSGPTALAVDEWSA